MMKQKWICLLMVVVMMLSFASCGGEYDRGDAITPDAETPITDPVDPKNTDPKPDPDPVIEDNIELKKCAIKVMLSDVSYFKYELSGSVLDVIRSKEELDTFVNVDTEGTRLGQFELYCDDYEESFFENSTILVYFDSSSSCCVPWVAKAEMAYDDEGNSWLRLGVDNQDDHEPHTEDIRQFLYLVEVSTTEIETPDDVEIVYGDYEYPTDLEPPVANQVGYPIEFGSIDSFKEYILAYNYKQYEPQYSRYYQGLMKNYQKVGYLYSLSAEGATQIGEGFTVRPDRYMDLGYEYVFEKDSVRYLVSIYRVSSVMTFDEEDAFYNYSYNRFGPFPSTSTEATVANPYFSESYAKFYRVTPYNTTDIFYRALIDYEYYIDVRTVDNTDTEGMIPFIESLSLEKVELYG